MWSHMFKLIANQWRSNLWIMVELFMSFVCIWLVADVLASLLSRKFKDKGFDLEHVYMVSYYTKSRDVFSYDAGSVSEDELRELAERIRRYPGVEAVGFASGGAFPYTGTVNGHEYFGDTVKAWAVDGFLSPDMVRVLRLTSAEPELDLEREAGRGDISLLSKTLIKTLTRSDATRIRFYTNDKRNNAHMGVRSNYVTDEYNDTGEERCLWAFWPEARLLKKRPQGSVEMFIRVRPEADHGFHDTFMTTMRERLTAGNTSIVGLTPMKDYRHYILGLMGINMMYGTSYFLSAFFLVCAFLGIIGTFWFRTEARTSEIGLRMALGATRRQVRRQMIGEGLMLFALVWIPGLVVVYLLRDVFSVYEVPLSAGWLFVILTVITTLVMALLIVAGIWVPARQASRINPVDALRYE